MVASAGLWALVCAAVAVSALPLGGHPAQGVVVRRELENTQIVRRANRGGVPGRSLTMESATSIASTASTGSGGQSTDPTSPSGSEHEGPGIVIQVEGSPSPPHTSPATGSPPHTLLTGSPPSSGPSTPRGAPTPLSPNTTPAPSTSTLGAGPSTPRPARLPLPQTGVAGGLTVARQGLDSGARPPGADGYQNQAYPWSTEANLRLQAQREQQAERERLEHETEMDRLRRMGSATPVALPPSRGLLDDARRRSRSPTGRRRLAQISTQGKGKGRAT